MAPFLPPAGSRRHNASRSNFLAESIRNTPRSGTLSRLNVSLAGCMFPVDQKDTIRHNRHFNQQTRSQAFSRMVLTEHAINKLTKLLRRI
jgi:hypothetical protein